MFRIFSDAIIFRKYIQFLFQCVPLTDKLRAYNVCLNACFYIDLIIEI